VFYLRLIVTFGCLAAALALVGHEECRGPLVHVMGCK
jgi:hypothetical protein